MEKRYKSEPIEEFHGEAIEEFHKGAEFKANETFVNGMRFINGIEFNRLLAKFKVKVIEEYGLKSSKSDLIDKIKWELYQCYGMDKPEAFQIRRIKTLITEHEEENE